jgi:hypothetical protein
MDNINLQDHLLQVYDNEYFKHTISEQQEKIQLLQANNTDLNTAIIMNEKRMVPKEYKEHYKLMLSFVSPSILKLLRRSKDSSTRCFERIRESPDGIFFKDALLISITFGKQFKDELAKIPIAMIGNLIEMNNQDEVTQILKQIEMFYTI